MWLRLFGLCVVISAGCSDPELAMNATPAGQGEGALQAPSRDGSEGPETDASAEASVDAQRDGVDPDATSSEERSEGDAPAEESSAQLDASLVDSDGATEPVGEDVGLVEGAEDGGSADLDDSGGIVVVGDGGGGPIFAPEDTDEEGGPGSGDIGEIEADSAGDASEQADVESDASEPGCEPNPCQQGQPPVCDLGVAQADFVPGQCESLAAGGVTCVYEPQRMDCIAAGGGCTNGTCTGSPPAPSEGDLVITEVMRAPLPNTRQWLEVYVAADSSVNMAGCGLMDGSGDITIFAEEPRIVEPGQFVLIAEVEPKSDGLPTPDIEVPLGMLDLLSTDQRLIFNCMGNFVDLIDYPTASPVAPFPAADGAAMQVSPQNYAADANDTADRWCAAEDPYTFGLYGTPGEPNPACNADIDRCKLWFPALTSGQVGEVIETLATVFDEGVTNITVNGPDPLPEFLAEVGIGPDGVNPEIAPDAFDWFSAAPSYDPPASLPPHEDMYGGWIIPSTSGVFDLAARFSPDAGVNWIYCDLDGSDNGYQLNKAGHVIVQP